MSHSGPTKYTIPETIQKRMADLGIENPTQLAATGEISTASTHRLFDPETKHTQLHIYRKMASLLLWDMQRLFDVCLNNHPEKSGEIISERIAALGMGQREFGRRMGFKSSGTLARYLSGKMSYEPMRNYATLCVVLGITPGDIYEHLLISSAVDNCSRIGKLTRSTAPKVWTNETNLIAAA